MNKGLWESGITLQPPDRSAEKDGKRERARRYQDARPFCSWNREANPKRRRSLH